MSGQSKTTDTNVLVTVGQTLYEPVPRRSDYRAWKVTGIGRKWIQLDNRARCDFQLRLDRGQYGYTQLYIDIKQYEADRRMSAAWSDLRRDLQYAKQPDGLTLDDIDSIRTKLGLQVFPRKEQP